MHDFDESSVDSIRGVFVAILPSFNLRSKTFLVEHMGLSAT